MQFEVAVECFSDSQATVGGTYVQSTFVTINADGSFTANQTLRGPPERQPHADRQPEPGHQRAVGHPDRHCLGVGRDGTVQFENNGTNINGSATVSGGTAATTFTPHVRRCATETLTAVYTPSGSFTAAPPGALTLTVNPAPANSGTIPLRRERPAVG